MSPASSPQAAIFDTNVLVYASDSSAPQHPRSLALRDAVEAGRIRGVVTTSILLEFFSVVTGTRVASPRTCAEALAQIAALASVFEVLPTRVDLVQRIDALGQSVPVRGSEVFDLAIAATALQAGVPVIYTYDPSVFGRVPGLTVLHP